MRDKFEDFKPTLPRRFKFDKKWRFALWSLERQERRLSILRRMFFKRVEIEESSVDEDLRSNSQPVRI